MGMNTPFNYSIYSRSPLNYFDLVIQFLFIFKFDAMSFISLFLTLFSLFVHCPPLKCLLKLISPHYAWIIQTEDPLANRTILYQMVAVYDYAAQGPEDLEFSEGDTIDILSEGEAPQVQVLIRGIRRDHWLVRCQSKAVPKESK